jgi:hypothetical protein
MGSISTHRAKGFTNDEWFRNEVFADHTTIVASSTIKSCYYAAVRDNTTGVVWAAVIPFTRSPRGHYNFCWKTMDETVGPGYHDAPAKVLDALTETDNEWANEWRAACRKNLERKQKTLAPGTVVRLGHSLTFWVGGTKVKATEFTYAPQPRRRDVFSVFAEALDARILVRLPDWKNYSYEEVGS